MPAVATEAPTTVEYHAWFQCIAGCPAHYSLQDIIYRCPRCGNLLEVRHDLERLRQHPPAYWKHLFDTRFLRNQWPYGSSVWGKKEMVCPEVDNANVGCEMKFFGDVFSFARNCSIATFPAAGPISMP